MNDNLLIITFLFKKKSIITVWLEFSRHWYRVWACSISCTETVYHSVEMFYSSGVNSEVTRNLTTDSTFVDV